ncbi:MAG: nitronate monooxygenase, partial [Alphaproteobacteria bacterium]|nr:nitronate monooxygenase [Alphaproteobacteria bacterium]
VRTKAWSGKPTRMMRSPWFDAWEREGAPAPLGTPLQRMLIAPSFQRIVAGGRADLMAVPVGQGVGQMTDRQRVRDVMYELQRDYLEAVARLTALQPTA